MSRRFQYHLSSIDSTAHARECMDGETMRQHQSEASACGRGIGGKGELTRSSRSEMERERSQAREWQSVAATRRAAAERACVRGAEEDGAWGRVALQLGVAPNASSRSTAAAIPQLGQTATRSRGGGAGAGAKLFFFSSSRLDSTCRPQQQVMASLIPMPSRSSANAPKRG
jgi:hypothetical protein